MSSSITELDIPYYIRDFLYLDPIIDLLFKSDPSSFVNNEKKYSDIIKMPMYVDLIIEKLKNNAYTSSNDLYNDVFLIFNNAMEFNEKLSYYYYEAQWLKEHFTRLLNYGDKIVRDIKDNKHALNGIIMHLENDINSAHFQHPEKNADYKNRVPNQMNLQYMKKRLNTMYVNTEYLLRDFRLILKNCVFYNGPPSSDDFSAVTYSRPCLALALSFYERYFGTFLNVNLPTRPHSSMLQLGNKPIAVSSNASSPKISATENTSPLNLTSTSTTNVFISTSNKTVVTQPPTSSIPIKPAASPPSQSPPTFLSTSSSISATNNTNRGNFNLISTNPKAVNTTSSFKPAASPPSQTQSLSSSSTISGSNNTQRNSITSVSLNNAPINPSVNKTSQIISLKPISNAVENVNNPAKVLSPTKDLTPLVGSIPVRSPNAGPINSPNFTIKLSKIPKKADPILLSGTTLVNKPRKDTEIPIQPKGLDVSKNIVEATKINNNNSNYIKKEELPKKVIESKKEPELSIKKVVIKVPSPNEKPKEVLNKPKITVASLIDDLSSEKVSEKRKAEDQGDNPFKIKFKIKPLEGGSETESESNLPLPLKFDITKNVIKKEEKVKNEKPLPLPAGPVFNLDAGKYPSKIFNIEFVNNTIKWLQHSDPNGILDRSIAAYYPRVTPCVSLYRFFFEKVMNEPNFQKDTHWFEAYGRYGSLKSQIISISSIHKNYSNPKANHRTNIAFAHDVRRLLSVSLTRPYHSDEFKLALKISFEFEAKLIEEQCVDIIFYLKRQYPTYYPLFVNSLHAPKFHFDCELPSIIPNDLNISLKSRFFDFDNWIGLSDFIGSFAWPNFQNDSLNSTDHLVNYDYFQFLLKNTNNIFFNPPRDASKENNSKHDYDISFENFAQENIDMDVDDGFRGGNNIENATESDDDDLTVNYNNGDLAASSVDKIDINISIENKITIIGFEDIAKISRKISSNILKKEFSNSSEFFTPSQFIVAVRQLLFYSPFVAASEKMSPSSPDFLKHELFSKSRCLRAEFDFLVEEQIFASSPIYVHPIHRINKYPLLFRCRKAMEILRSKLDQKINVFATFIAPVPPTEFGLFDYFTVVKRPTDLSTCKRQLVRGMYNSEFLFLEQIQLVFENSRVYHSRHSEYMVEQSNLADEKWEQIWQKVIKDYSELLVSVDPFNSKLPLHYDEIIEDDIFILKSLLPEKTKEVIETFNPSNPFGFLNQLIKQFPEFSTPVDTKLYNTYLNFVKQPMDLRKIQRNLTSGFYSTLESMATDLKLIFNVDENSIIRVKCYDYHGRLEAYLVELNKNKTFIAEQLELIKDDAAKKAQQLLLMRQTQAAQMAAIATVRREKASVRPSDSSYTPSYNNKIKIAENRVGIKSVQNESNFAKSIRSFVLDVQKKPLDLTEQKRQNLINMIDTSFLDINNSDFIFKEVSNDEKNSNSLKMPMDLEFKTIVIDTDMDLSTENKKINNLSIVSNFGLSECKKLNLSHKLELIVPLLTKKLLPGPITNNLSLVLQTCRVKEFDKYKLFVKNRKNNIPASKLFPYELVHEQVSFIALSGDVEFIDNDDEKSSDSWNFWLSTVMDESLPDTDHVAVVETFQPPSMSVSSREYKNFKCWSSLLETAAESNIYESNENASFLKTVYPLQFVKSSENFSTNIFLKSQGITSGKPIKSLTWNDSGFYYAITTSYLSYLPTISVHIVTLKN